MPFGADLAHSVLEIIPRNNGFIFNSRTVVVDGVYRVSKERCDARRVGNAEFDESENTEFGIEHSGVFQNNLSLLAKKGVELLDKGRIEAQKCVVEVGVELILGIFDDGRVFEFRLERLEGAL